ncbi:hypothetical protein PTRA_a3143 [Pseudoalteromonas translucida KMM 520]|uniref:Orphan protein n=1 Tax=Pseudoalteromonas translucida KMM 520 TaxID=1315283 RepID=A0A0U2LQC8_9GAMM|nr:hypothetical protein [Pseudoalteromonas translucida]ALS34150.1 hypothetical protein PTRA_a3143 [Pseudoalteromonas translucida KMM 520]
MELCIQLLNARLAKYQLDELDNDFKQLTPAQQANQLMHLYQSAQRMSVKYNFMQNVAIRILTNNPLPTSFISQLSTLDALSFFTPALKVNKGFLAQNEASNTVLHTVFKQPDANNLPFNYVRSLMLFESNDDLLKALALPNQQGLTPVACYIAYANKPTTPIKHEFSALLALMEMEQKQNAQAKQQLLNVLQGNTVNETTLLLSAAYLQRSIPQVINLLSQKGNIQRW